MGDLKVVRQKYNLTQKDIADEFGISIRAVQNWEYRKNCPSNVYNIICKYYQLLERKKIMDEELLFYRNFEHNGGWDDLG